MYKYNLQIFRVCNVRRMDVILKNDGWTAGKIGYYSINYYSIITDKIIKKLYFLIFLYFSLEIENNVGKN